MNASRVHLLHGSLGLALLAVEETPPFLPGFFGMSVRTVNERLYLSLTLWLFVVVKKIKQFPILLGCHNSMGANSYAIKMQTIFFAPIMVQR